MYKRLLWFVSLLSLVGIFMVASPSKPALALACGKFQAPYSSSMNGATKPYGYYVDRNIDGDSSDEEYVFTVAPSWAVDYWRIKWGSSSSVIRTIASVRWRNTLGVASYCRTPILVWADKLAVDVSGGPNSWKSNIWIGYQ